MQMSITEPCLLKLYRVEGADVYGSFLIGITLKDTSGKVILQKNGEDLALFPLTNIKNDYIAKVVPGKHSLIIPLGSKLLWQLEITVCKIFPKASMN